MGNSHYTTGRGGEDSGFGWPGWVGGWVWCGGQMGGGGGMGGRDGGGCGCLYKLVIIQTQHHGNLIFTCMISSFRSKTCWQCSMKYGLTLNSGKGQ